MEKLLRDRACTEALLRSWSLPSPSLPPGRRPTHQAPLPLPLSLRVANPHASSAQTYQRTLLAGKAAAAPLLAPAVAALVGAWEAARAPAAADALGTAAEVFGAEPGRAPLLAGALERVCAAAAPDGGVRERARCGPCSCPAGFQPAARGRMACFQGQRCCAAVLAAGGRSRRGGRGGGRSEAMGRKRQGALLRERPEAAAALLGLLDRCMLLAPGALAAARALPAGLRLALAAAGGRETDPARAGLSLLGHALVSARGALAPQARHALAYWRGLCRPAFGGGGGAPACGVAHARSVTPAACGEAGLARAAPARRRAGARARVAGAPPLCRRHFPPQQGPKLAVVAPQWRTVPAAPCFARPSAVCLGSCPRPHGQHRLYPDEALTLTYPQVEAALANGGAGAAATALLRAAADTCPQQLLRAAATALRALLASGAHGSAARAAVVHALSAPDFPGTSEPHLP